LHEHTGALVREAAQAGYAVVVTDRGRPVATMAPWEAQDERRAFRDRELSTAFLAVQRKRPLRDSSADISADRER
jgi:antitoxin (DNA-binding transcriptional repressor) of toxin-antitoxin stability system